MAAPADPDRLHRLVISIAVVVAWVAVLAFGIAYAVTADAGYLSHMIGPGTAGTFFGWQMLRGRPNAFSGMVVGALAIIGAFTFAGRPDTAVGSAIALVYVGVIGSAFITDRVREYVVGGSVVLFASPYLWRHNLGDADALTTAIIMSASFAVGVATVSMVMRNAARSHERFRDLFETAPVGLLEQDWSEAIAHARDRLPAGEDTASALRADPKLTRAIVDRVMTLRANRAAGTVLARPAEQLIGPVSKLMLPDDSYVGWVEPIAAIYAGETSASFELTLPTASSKDSVLEGEFMVSDDGASVIASFKDVTDARRAAQALEDLVKAKDKFIASVSHELRTPLTAVLGLTQELRSGRVADESERAELLALIAAQSTEVAHLVEDLLVGARADIGTVTVQPREIDLVAEAAHVLAEMGVTIPLEASSQTVTAHADPIRVRQILRNLVSNSLRYGGSQRRILVSGGDAVTVEMRDSGLPLAHSDRDRVFEAYERAHERPGITASVGLGLAVSRQLARLMSGDLTYDHDGEAVFRLSVPAASPREAMTLMPPVQVPPAHAVNRHAGQQHASHDPLPEYAGENGCDRGADYESGADTVEGTEHTQMIRAARR